MQESLNRVDYTAIQRSYTHLASFIAYVSELAGIPPGSTPSTTVNVQIAKAYRRMTTSVSKLELSNTISKDGGASAGDHDATDKIQMSLQETDNLVSEAKTFIAVYCQALSLNFQSPTVQNLESLQDPTFEARQSRIGAWTDNLTPPTAGEQSLAVEPLSASIPLDREAVNVLDHQRNMILNVLKQAFSLLDMKVSTVNSSGLNADQFMKDRRNLLLSSFNSFTLLVTNMSNLVESIDLTPLQAKQSSSQDGSNSLLVLYEFLQLKQTLYDELVSVISSVQQASVNSEDMVAQLARSLAGVNLNSQDPNEEVIKKRALEVCVTIDSLVQRASTLADEAMKQAGAYNDPSSAKSIVSVSSSGVSQGVHRVRTRASGSSLATSNISASAKEEWFLQPEFSNELAYNAKHQFRGGSFRALVERLTQHNAVHSTFNTALLLTYRSFTTPQELFQELTRRYDVQPPDGLNMEELNVWTEKKQKPIRQRVANVLGSWIEEHWYEDCKIKPIKILLSSMLAFSERVIYDGNADFERVSSTIENMLAEAAPPRKPAMPKSPAPPSVLPRNLKKMKVLDIEPVELARQLTIREYNILKCITPAEILNRRQRKILTRGGVTSNETKYMDAFIHNSNELTNWVAYVILKHNDAKKRAAAVKYFVTVADHCRQCNNFSSMMAIVSALQSATIHRMKRTWAAVSGRTHESLTGMNKLMSSHGNFHDYRHVLASVSLPVVPFFGVYLSDLTALEDSQPDSLDSANKTINMVKRVKTAEIIKDLVHYQSMGYNFTEVAAIQTLLGVGFSKAAPIDKQYETSLSLEPRERANERMARLLEETGYL